MSQERLNGLAILFIEKKLLDEINIDTRVENKNENFRLPATVFEILPRFWCK